MKKVSIRDVPLEAAFNGTVHKKIVVRAENPARRSPSFRKPISNPEEK